MIFGRCNNMVPVPTSYYGQSGWFLLPTGYYTKPNPDCPCEVIASPNADFSRPIYYCKLKENGQDLVYQDILLSKVMGTDNNNGQ